MASPFRQNEGITLAGVTMPGRWFLTEATRVYGFQIQKGFGQSGGTVFPIGDDPMPIKYSVAFLTLADVMKFMDLQKTILKKPVFTLGGTNATTAGLGIDEPALKAVGVNTVVVKGVSAVIHPLVTSGGKGPWTSSVEFLEYRKPVPALPKPSQSIPDTGAPQPTAQDALDLENQKLAQTFANKSSQLASKFVPQ
jgi:hypothetical protein